MGFGSAQGGVAVGGDVALALNDDVALSLGTSVDASWIWETADADAHYLNLFLGASRNLVISEDGNVDWTHATSTDPHVFIQSSDSGTVADYIVLYHDQTNANIDVGAGDLLLNIAGGNLAPDADDGWALGIANGGEISDLFLASGAVIGYANGDVSLTHSSGAMEWTGYNDFTLTQAVSTSGSPSALTVTVGAHTTLATTAEAPGVDIDASATVEFASGNISAQRTVKIQAATYGFAGASTISDCSTLALGEPTAGTNATFTRTHALKIESGWITCPNTGTEGIRMGTQSHTNFLISVLNLTNSTVGNSQAGAIQLCLNVAGNVNDLAQIGLGFASGTAAGNEPPAIIGFDTTSATTNTLGDIFFATRTVTSDTAPTIRWRITSAGHLTAVDDTHDIGAAGATRPRNLHVAGYLRSTLNAGTANTGVTAVEYGDGYNHVSVLTVSQTDALTLADNASICDGYLLYTFPAGVVVIDYVRMNLDVTAGSAQLQGDTPDVGLGTVIGTGAVSVLDGTATFEDIVTGQAAADANGTNTVKTLQPTAGAPFIIESGGAHTLHFNVAAVWSDDTSTDLTADISGTVEIAWRFLA